MNELEIQKPVWEYGRNALTFLDNPSWEQAEVLSNTIMKMKDGVDMWMGDAALRFAVLWPQTHYQLWDDRYTGKSVDNRMREAKKIPPPRRRGVCAGGISAICGLDTEEEQDRAIEIADREKMTVAEVRDLVKDMKGTTRQPPPPKIRTVKCQCPACEEQFDIEVEI